MTFLETLMNAAGEEASKQCADSIEFFRMKLSPATRVIEKWNPGEGEEALCQRFLRLTPKVRSNFVLWLALCEDWELLPRLMHYHYNAVQFISQVNYPKIFTSRDEYEKWRRGVRAGAEECVAKNAMWNAYNLYNYMHDVEKMRSEGVPYLFSNMEYYSVPDTIMPALHSLYLLLSLELTERARDYSRAVNRFKASDENYPDCVDWDRCLRSLLNAQLAKNPAARKRHAARAVIHAMTSVVTHWSRARTLRGLDVMSDDLSLALSIAIDYDFDPAWSERATRILLSYLHYSSYHPFVLKAVERNLWVQPWHEVSELSPERVFEIYSPIKRSHD